MTQTALHDKLLGIGQTYTFRRRKEKMALLLLHRVLCLRPTSTSADANVRILIYIFFTSVLILFPGVSPHRLSTLTTTSAILPAGYLSFPPIIVTLPFSLRRLAFAIRTSFVVLNMLSFTLAGFNHLDDVFPVLSIATQEMD